jgi:signal transduction histidine kinase
MHCGRKKSCTKNVEGPDPITRCRAGRTGRRGKQAPKGSLDRKDGTGMGLRISRSIIESHGGRLWAVGSPGRGATFHVNLPAARNVPQSPANTA